MILNFLPELVVAVSLSFPLYRRLSELAQRTQEVERGDGELVSKGRALEKIELLSSAYRSLSQVFSLLSEGGRRPSEAEYREVCAHIVEHFVIVRACTVVQVGSIRMESG